MNLQINNTRDHVIKACEERGLIFKAVITTASPFAEVINPEEYPFILFQRNPADQASSACLSNSREPKRLYCQCILKGHGG